MDLMEMKNERKITNNAMKEKEGKEKKDMRGTYEDRK